MGTKIAAERFLDPTRFLVWVFFFSISFSLPNASGYEMSSVAHPTTLRLSSGLLVENSPGSKPGALMACERVRIVGLPRLQNLQKYANSLKVKVNTTGTSSRALQQNAEVCFHRNASLGIGMCPEGEWEKLIKGSWARSMSPYSSRFLDIRMPGSSLESLEVSTEEDFLLHRIIFLVLGVVMMTLAPSLSQSVVFYYSSAMAVGIILVILIVLFQGMKLLPTGRKSSLAIFMYSSIVGVGSFLLSYLSGLLRSFIVQLGVSEEIYSPVAIFLLVCLVLAGAWLGFWGVRKLVLTEDGSVDINIAQFVEWSIRIFAAAMILQSSVDSLLATVALLCGIIFSSITRRIGKSRFIRHPFKHLLRAARNLKYLIDNSVHGDSGLEYMHEIRRSKSELQRPRSKPYSLASCSSVPGSKKASPYQPSDADAYYSTFHETPERKRFSKEEWENFTKESTKKALEGLVSSPDFTQWAVANAERITLTPTDDSSGKMKGQRRRWLNWL
ncbi:Transmembrane protein 194 [Cinnamomum micranthum f. kanehirae]|uniref:Transmembrane protein 194 n=1 Tax=Cinnamomum micranthum f. kanehirae TaxID=337451 RepID=A0A3S3MK86_9MAGN|nr:Transmembrane protein 194 [Cinnamomum micranthum f. kanehirae]